MIKKNNRRGQHRKYMPYAFTEQGIAMLSGILKSDVAIKVSINIIEKFNKQYPILKIAKTNVFHDRFIVIDSKDLYHIGASLKDLGKKCFGINKIEDMNFIENIKNNIEI